MSQNNTKIYRLQGGNEEIIESGGIVTVKSGGIVALESGASLNLASGAALVAASGSYVVDPSVVRSETYVLTRAEVNATAIMLAGVTGKQLRLVEAVIMPTGTFDGAAAAMVCLSGAGTSIVGWATSSALDASLEHHGTNAVNAGITFYPLWDTWLASGEGIAVKPVGGEFNAGTSLTIQLFYRMRNAV